MSRAERRLISTRNLDAPSPAEQPGADGDKEYPSEQALEAMGPRE